MLRILALLLLTLALPAAAEEADLVLRRGAVYCVDAPRRWAQAVALKNGRIVYVGSDQGVEAWVGSSTRRVDLQGRMVLPGFCDSHVHPLLAGLEAMHCQLTDLTTPEAVFAKIRSYAAAHPAESWIVGSGWALPLFPQGNPTRQQLDGVVSDRPVALEAADGHSLWVNSKALEMCGITRETPDPPGGRIEREASGAPSGTLRENAMKLVKERAPKATLDERCQALRWGLERLARVGVTTLHEADASPEDLEAYHYLEEHNQLTARVVASQAVDPELGVGQIPALLERRQRFWGPLLHPAAAKLFADGVLETRTAALLQPYAGSQERGNLLIEPTRMAELVTALDAAGVQVHIHAIGDRAVRAALDSFAAARKANPDKDLRHHIAHLQLIDPLDIPRFRALGVAANFQAFWAQADDYVTRLTDPVLGPERAQRQYSLASVFNTGAVVVGGSDWSVSTPNPLDAIEVALTRCALGQGGPPWIPQERVTLAPMLAAYTIAGAYLGHLEGETGSLEVGKTADLIVLSHNLFEVPPHKIHEVKVELTLLAGKPVYAASPKFTGP